MLSTGKTFKNNYFLENWVTIWGTNPKNVTYFEDMLYCCLNNFTQLLAEFTFLFKITIGPWHPIKLNCKTSFLSWTSHKYTSRLAQVKSLASSQDITYSTFPTVVCRFEKNKQMCDKNSNAYILILCSCGIHTDLCNQKKVNSSEWWGDTIWNLFQL